MLRHITVRDFAIIDNLEIALDARMTAMTGETGAGKSILIDVIGLLLGDRGDAASVREGAAQADLSAEFDLPRKHPAVQWMAERELADPPAKSDLPEPVSLLLRRVVNAQGKSRAWINGRPVTVTQLREVGQWLVDIHGQHAHQLLLQRGAQRALLDGFVDEELRHEVAAAHTRLQQAKQRLAEARTRLADTTDRIDLLRFQTAEIQDLGPQAGEYANIAAEQTRLAHASEVLAALQAAHQAIEDDAGIDHGIGQVLGGLHEAMRHDNRIGPALELLESARIQIQEAVDQLRRLADRIEIDPVRLAEIDRRMAAYLRLARKYQIDPDQLPDRLQSMQAELADLDDGDARVEALEREAAAAETRYDAAATALSSARRAAAAKLDAAVTAAMQDLGMPGGRFRVDVQEQRDQAGPQGRDRVEFQVAANPGSTPLPLARVASGGELSRIGLALQVLVSAEQTVDTLIFDEVDSGISGAVAEVVGRKLRALGERYQVLCVTHLPQVAAQAHWQLQVRKQRDRNQARTEVMPLTPSGRVEAIARMLGGITLTERSLAHAQEMLATALAGTDTTADKRDT